MKPPEAEGGNNSSSQAPALAAGEASGVGVPREHVWFQYHALTCCRVCGLVKRRNGLNNPCKGPTRIELRGDDA